MVKMEKINSPRQKNRFKRFSEQKKHFVMFSMALFTLILCVNLISSSSWDSNYDVGLRHAYSFNQESGGTLNDLVGGQFGVELNGNITEALWSSSCINGNCLDFDGSNDWVSLSNDSDWDWILEKNDFTISYWVRADDISTSSRATVTNGEYNPPNHLGMFAYLEIPSKYYDSTLTGSLASRLRSKPLSEGYWYNIVVRRNGTGTDEVSIFINGTMEDTATWTSVLNTSCVMAIGRSPCWANNYYFDGTIDELYFWNRSLNDSEVAGLYNSGSGAFYDVVAPPEALTGWQPNYNIGLRHYYPFDENTGTTATDIIGSKYGVQLNGTINNAVYNATAKNGTSLEFDGSGDWVNFSSDAEWNYILESNDFTISYWMSFDDIASSSRATFTNAVYSPPNHLGFFSYVETPSSWLSMQINDTVQSILKSNPLPQSNWIHVVIRRNGTQTDEVSLWINGTLTDTATWSNVLNSTCDMMFGDSPCWANHNYYKGIADELAVWNRSLNDTEIVNLYNNGTGIFYQRIVEFPVVTIDSPLNQTYTNFTIGLNVSANKTINNWWYSNDSGASNYSFTPNITRNWDIGSNTIYVWANDTEAFIGTANVTFYIDLIDPIITIDSPENKAYNVTSVDFNWYVDETSDCFYSLDGSANASISTNITFTNLSDDTHLVEIWCNDSYGNLGNASRPFKVDTEPPEISWYSPYENENPLVNTDYVLNVSVNDTYLDAVNITVYNATGSEVYNNWTQNITVGLFWIGDTVTLNEGNNTVEICARDSLASSPKIIDEAQFTKRNAEETEHVLPNGNTVVREIVVKDADKKKLSAEYLNLTTIEEWDEYGEHYKTTWEFNEANVSFFEIVMYDDNGELELLTDRGRTRVVDKNRNYYWSYEDIEQAGFDVEYTQNEDTIEIKVTLGDYIVENGRWIVDPIVAGLNSKCENETIRLDSTPPTAESGGSGGSGTTPINNTYTNQSAQNFSVNATDESGIQNITLFILNESDDIINQTTIDTGGNQSIFVQILYYLWYEGIYKWYFKVVDTVNNVVDTAISQITYDTTNPNIYITNLSDVVTDTLPVNISFNYSINDTNLFNCSWEIGALSGELNCSETTGTAYVNTDGNFDLTIRAEDLVGQEASDTESFFVFYHNYVQETETDVTTEGSVVTFDIEINMTDVEDTSAIFVYNGIESAPDSYSIDSNGYSFSIDYSIPDGAGNSTGNNASWYWKYSIEAPSSYYVENYTTPNQSQIVYSVEIDNCTAYNETILNIFELNDEETDTLMNSSLNPVIEASVTITSLGDSSIYWEYNTTFTNATTGQICIPDTLLNYSSYRFDAVIGFEADEYAKEFWYLDNATLEEDNFYLDDWTTRNITLRDLLLADSTTFLFTFYDENYLIHEGAIVTLLRYYIGEGVFKEAERGKMDDNGETHLHLVQEDVIYKFRVTEDGELLYTSGEYNAKCQEVPCIITLDASSTPEQLEDEFLNLPEGVNGTYALSGDKTNRSVTLDFDLVETAEMNLTVYEYSNSEESDILVDSDSVIAKSGTITVSVPLSYENVTYYAVVRHNGDLVTSRWIDLSESGFAYFGVLGVVMGALLVLTLGLIAVTSGGWSVLFLILGLLISAIAKLVDMSFYLILYVVCAGGLIVYKLALRRSA